MASHLGLNFNTISYWENLAMVLLAWLVSGLIMRPINFQTHLTSSTNYLVSVFVIKIIVHDYQYKNKLFIPENRKTISGCTSEHRVNKQKCVVMSKLLSVSLAILRSRTNCCEWLPTLWQWQCVCTQCNYQIRHGSDFGCQYQELNNDNPTFNYLNYDKPIMYFVYPQALHVYIMLVHVIEKFLH